MTRHMEIIDILPGLPAAVVIALFLLTKYWNDIRAGIGKVYSDRQSDAEDKREAHQSVAESRVDFEFQRIATEAAQDYYERRSIIGILEDQLEHSREDISGLQQGQSEIKTELVKIKELIRVQNIALSKIEENTRK